MLHSVWYPGNAPLKLVGVIRFSHIMEKIMIFVDRTYHGFSTGIYPQVNIRHNRNRGNGLMGSSEVKQLYLSHQISLKNINCPLSYLAKLCLSKLTRTMISSLLMFEFGIFRVYFVVFMKVLSRFRGIKRSRKLCMSKMACLSCQYNGPNHPVLSCFLT